jgi:hypothetical protein
MKNKLFLIFVYVLLVGCQSKESIVKNESVPKTETLEVEIKLIEPEVKLEEFNYIAKEGVTLKGVLSEWSIKNGYRLEWSVRASNGDEIDWKIERSIVANKDYFSSVSDLLKAYKNSDGKIKFIWKFYKSNRVLVIRLGDTN